MRIFVYLLLWVIFQTGAFGQPVAREKLTPHTRSILRWMKNHETNAPFSRQYQKSFVLSDKNGQLNVNAFVMLEKGADIRVLDRCGAKVNSQIGEIVTISVPVDSIGVLSSLSEVKRIDAGQFVDLKMDTARIVGKVDELHLGTGLSHPFKGNGVIIGIVDTGFDYGHVNFISPVDQTLRIKRVWDQDNEKGVAPEGFYYGSEFDTEAAILRAGYDVKNDTHATHVTGIAAGSNESCPYYGVATQAELAVVGMSAYTRDNVTILDGVKYLFDYAQSVGKPCVVNLSLGKHMGPHDGTSLFDMACDELQGPGRLMVGAAGNEGATALHIIKQISPVDTLKTFLSFPSGAKYGRIDFWGEPDKAYKIKLYVYNRNTGKRMFNSVELDASIAGEQSYTLKSLASDGVVGLIDFYTEKNPLNNKSNAYIEAYFDMIAEGNYLGLEITGEEGLVHGWVDGNGAAFTDNFIPGYISGDTDFTVGEIGGTGKRIITVGAYAVRNKFTNIAGSKRTTDSFVGDLATFSSRGPSADERMKPDITAPGAEIFSSFSDAVAVDDYYKNLIIEKCRIGGKDTYYGVLRGTSMASPFVAGTLAAWLEAYPGLSPEEVRNVLQKTAVKDTFTGEEPNNRWGYGKIDALNGIKEVLNLRAQNIQETEAESFNFRIYPVCGGVNIYFTNEDSGTTVSVYNLNGQKVYSRFIGHVSVSHEENIGLKLEKGIYLVSVKGDKHNSIKRFVLN